MQVHRYVSMPFSLLTSSPCVLAMDAIDTRDALEAMADRGSWGPTNNSETEMIQANKYIQIHHDETFEVVSRKQSAARTRHTNRLCVRSLLLLKVLRFSGLFPAGSPHPPNANCANLRRTRVTWSSLFQMAAPEKMKPRPSKRYYKGHSNPRHPKYVSQCCKTVKYVKG